MLNHQSKSTMNGEHLLSDLTFLFVSCIILFLSSTEVTEARLVWIPRVPAYDDGDNNLPRLRATQDDADKNCNDINSKMVI